MILKVFELNKLNLDKYNIYLLYGKNEGRKNEIIKSIFFKNFNGEVIKYDENEFLSNSTEILSEILNKSLFEEKKIFIISRATDKILKVTDEILKKNPSDIKLIIKSGILEKKSKLRNLFEKNIKLVTIPFYEDDDKNLLSIINNFLKEHKITLSRESINLLINRARGDRGNLNIELEKIHNYSLSNKNIKFKNVQTLTNLAENYNVTELADNYLNKNRKNISRILNENTYSAEDCILILRTISNKSKRLLNIIDVYQRTKNIEGDMSTIKPPIFWKEKEIVKKQVITWKKNELENKIYKINDIECLIKSNSGNSLNLLSDFIINY